MQSVQSTLEERNSTHGDYGMQAGTSQAIQMTMQAGVNWSRLTCTQRDALQMISVKISRILTGNPNHADSWHDIAGYAMLVERELTT